MIGTLQLHRARSSLRRVAPGEIERLSRAIAAAESAEGSAIEQSARNSQTRGYWLLTGLIVLVALGKALLADTMDPDAFWHLRVADQLIAEGIHPLVDQISFASLREPWTPYSWLAELIMREIWNLGGHHLASLVTALASAGIVIFTARAMLASCSSPLAALLCTAAAAFLTLPFISFRPVTFALLLFAIVIDLVIRRPSRGIWLMPPLLLLMTNVHLYAGICAAVVTLIAIASWWDDPAMFRRNLLLAGLTGIAACATPMLPGVIDTALRYNGQDPMVAANYITEMRPFWWGLTGKFALAIVVGSAFLLVARWRIARVADWLLIALAILLAFRLGRFMPLFALIALPRVARLLPLMPLTVIRKPLIQMALSTAVVVGMAGLAIGYPHRLPLDAWLNRNAPAYPTAAAAWVDEHVPATTGRIINEFNWGGYLAWRLGTRYQVLLDGRTQLYAPEFWRATHLGDDAARQAFLSTVDADVALLPANRSAFGPALESLGWKVVYRDELAMVLLPR